MSGFDIASKVKGGLAKAAAATGGAEYSVMLVHNTSIKDPLYGDVVTIEKIELVNAIISKIENTLSSEGAKDSKIRLVCYSETELTQGDVIEIGSDRYIAESVELKKPRGVLLAQIATLRRI